MIVKRLAESGALTTAMSRSDAVDVAWFATDPMLFDRFVRIRGWSVSRFEAWLTRLLVGQLVAWSSGYLTISVPCMVEW